MTTGATLFSGGELCGVGMRQAGIEHRWGIELDPAIAGVAQANGFNVIVADVLTVDPAQMEPVDCLHASPVCTRASSANQSAELNEEGTKEAPLDIAMGEKVARFIDVLQPQIFTLENVFAYRNFKAFKVICAALDRGGYFWDFDNLNAADFGVPQTRRRLILRAVRGALLPMLPQAEWWRGWYGAVEDLIPGLPESRFAPWQLERLPAEIAGPLMAVVQGAASDYLLESEPAQTIAANHAAVKYRAFVPATEPVHTVTGESNGRTRAFLVADEYGSPKNGDDRILFTRDTDELAMSVKASIKATYRAWLVGGGNTQLTQVDSHARRDNEPSFTVFTGTNHIPRAWLSAGRVVAMTPWALARFQSCPDSYILPASNKLACTVIGNGVACRLARKIYEGLIGVIQ